MEKNKFNAEYIPYRETGAFSNIVEDYLNQDPALENFYTHKPSLEGIQNAIRERKGFNYNRHLLHSELNKQYSSIPVSRAVQSNIDSLLSENTFTVCTAHQPNIFTGHLYFIYKILHAIKLAEQLNESLSGYHFVPVYYMGSEDADLEELGEVTINGKRFEWKTDQTGAVGRMKVDKLFISLISEIESQLSVEKFGPDIITLIKESYVIGRTIEQSTFILVNKLFEDRGLLVFLPDNPGFKRQFYSVSEKELTQQFSYKAVTETLTSFPEKYKAQVAGREINLFYLKNDIRERIEKLKDRFVVANSDISFTEEEILSELNNNPERFSPNVILRPVFQDLVLPNIVFIGGGGELAYWLELKDVFAAANVPYPVLVLRNSYLLITKKIKEQIKKLQFSSTDFFKPAKTLIEELVKRETDIQLLLVEEKASMVNVYQHIKMVAGKVDVSLENHVEALQVNAIKRLNILEKKMLKSEKKKFDASLRQIMKIKSSLYPNGTLQERIDNLMPYYAMWGKEFLDILYNHANGLEQEFCILTEE